MTKKYPYSAQSRYGYFFISYSRSHHTQPHAVEARKPPTKSKKPLTVRHKSRQFAVLKTSYICKKIGICMVEARRIELLSEGSATQVSPSAVSVLNFAPLTPTDRLLKRYLDKVSQSALRELSLRYPTN